MRYILRTFSMAVICMLLISANCIEKVNIPVAGEQSTIVPNYNKGRVKAHKLNFFQKLIVKIYLKRNKLLDSARADKLASTSLLLGVGACGFLVLGLFIPYVILATIPAGIAAMITGGSAVRNGTSMVGKAKTGKALGLGALIAFGVVLLAAIIIVASFLAAI